MIDLFHIKPKALAGGIASLIPGIRTLTNRSSGGTCSTRYCYSVWLRHLVRARASGLPTSYGCVAELGPGDSIGSGLAAVLCGANRYVALDVKAHADVPTNLRVFDELLALFRARAPIPDDAEFPRVQPKLADYRFPHDILPEARLAAALSDERVTQVRGAIEGRASAVTIVYVAPWYDPSVVLPASVDMLFSQAVLEHVEDLETTYRAMRQWMKHSGFMSHSIDFSSHDVTRSWNGHWTLNDTTWRLILGARPYLINRQPLSRHLGLISANGFDVVKVDGRKAETGAGFRPARRFASMTPEDMQTTGAFVQARVRRSRTENPGP